uniref:Uncharacterized protein n=1 Tax=Timema monikensis TaxID=170555 RepID=A0A7R9E176_9NEOP|nr:unnamed protein product [Timema monikensis]
MAELPTKPYLKVLSGSNNGLCLAHPTLIQLKLLALGFRWLVFLEPHMKEVPVEAGTQVNHITCFCSAFTSPEWPQKPPQVKKSFEELLKAPSADREAITIHLLNSMISMVMICLLRSPSVVQSPDGSQSASASTDDGFTVVLRRKNNSANYNMCEDSPAQRSHVRKLLTENDFTMINIGDIWPSDCLIVPYYGKLLPEQIIFEESPCVSALVKAAVASDLGSQEDSTRTPLVTIDGGLEDTSQPSSK